MPLQADQRTRGALRMAPVGSAHVLPPVGDVLVIHRAAGLHEDQRPGVQHLRQGAGIVGGIGRQLGERGVTGGLDEPGELLVGDRVRSIQNPSTVTRWTGRSSG